MTYDNNQKRVNEFSELEREKNKLLTYRNSLVYLPPYTVCDIHRKMKGIGSSV